MKASVHLLLGNVSYPIQLLKQIEESGELGNSSAELQAYFYRTEVQVMHAVINVLTSASKVGLM